MFVFSHDRWCVGGWQMMADPDSSEVNLYTTSQQRPYADQTAVV